jgi:predicted HicB family RNase H-like nuclease
MKKAKVIKFKPRERLQTAQLVVRLTDEEHRAFMGRALEKGLSMSAWARMTLRESVFSSGREARGE